MWSQFQTVSTRFLALAMEATRSALMARWKARRTSLTFLQEMLTDRRRRWYKRMVKDGTDGLQPTSVKDDPAIKANYGWGELGVMNYYPSVPRRFVNLLESWYCSILWLSYVCGILILVYLSESVHCSMNPPTWNTHALIATFALPLQVPYKDPMSFRK